MEIGIITMHRVQNMGSVLQAYALQHKIEQMGYNAELIDYLFPLYQKKKINIKEILSSLLNICQGFPKQKRLNKLNAFRKEYLHCSQKEYSREALLNCPPDYDIYCTGSDQVWNPKNAKEDTSFMLDFAPVDKPRISYASSFASKVVEEPYFSLYAKFLSKYNDITVREQSGAEIIKKMIGKDVTIVCDPTLLLSTKEWHPIAESSNLKLPKAYILVYLLRYMFDPRPGFYDVIESVRKTLKLPVYFFNAYTWDAISPSYHNFSGMGPCDFVKLVENASFIVTDSFHGTAFATIFNIPMIGVVKDKYKGDGRIATLRNIVGGEHSVVCHNQSFCMNTSGVDFYKCNEEKVIEYRDNSTKKLLEMLSLIK